jgi:CHASE2 domain-containing sensor protein
VSKRGDHSLEHKPWKLLLWTALAGLIFGLIGFGEIAEDWLRVARNSFHMHKASGQVVMVKFDDHALRAYGNWPWPRRRQAELIDRLSGAGAKQILFDINFSYPSNPADDRSFADAIRRSGRVVLGTRTRAGIDGTGIHEICATRSDKRRI